MGKRGGPATTAGKGIALIPGNWGISVASEGGGQ